MKKNKGFTIVELLAVIVILGIVMTLTIPAVTNSQSAAKQKAYETKINNFENAAIIYAQDNYRTLISGKTEDEFTVEIKVQDLLENGYLTGNQDILLDPRDTSKSLKDSSITITIDKKTRKITASFKTTKS